jgi:hypothetical protein
MPLKWRRFEDTPEGQRILEERAMKTPSVIPASFSSMEAYNTCPKQFYETRILKNWKQVETPEMDWGNRVHKALEQNVKYKRELPENMKQYNWVMDALLKGRREGTQVEAELEVACTEDKHPTGFWDGNCWVRGKIDVLAHDEEWTTALNGDHKTGKFKPNSKQLELSTLLCFAQWPSLKKVLTAFFWLAESDPAKCITQKLYVRNDDDTVTTKDDKGKLFTRPLEEMWAPFEQNVGEMQWSLQNNAWPANKSGLCKAHCPVLTCSFNGKRP